MENEIEGKSKKIMLKKIILSLCMVMVIFTGCDKSDTEIIYRVVEKKIDNVDSGSVFTSQYEYNDKGQVIKEIYLDENNKIIYRFGQYIYDNEGKCIEKKRYEDESTIAYGYYEMEYDENGNCVREEYNSYTSHGDYYREYEYDENNNCVKSGDGEIYSQYEYNAEGHHIKTITNFVNINTVNTARLENTFDKNGNCIMQELYNENDELYRIITYTYQKFEVNKDKDEMETTILGRWRAVTTLPFGMEFNGMYFPSDMEFYSDGSFTEYYSEKDMEGTYVLDEDRLKIVEDMSAGVRDRIWKYDVELSAGRMKLIWENGIEVEYTKITIYK